MIPFWFVAFHDGAEAGARWVRWCTRPGFRHCFAFGVDPASSAWLLVDPAWSRLNVQVVPRDWANAWLAMAGDQIILLKVTQAAEGRVRPRLLVTCAGAIAALVGLAGSHWRPQGLYRTLRRRGAVEIGRSGAMTLGQPGYPETASQ